MKKFISILICALFSVVAFAQEGVDFQQLTYEEALAKAKAENKLVFMDCYTSWCGPCKHMTTNVFPQKAAGEFFNPRFVNVKFDMEKGEGKELRQKFGVKAYPTFLMIRPDGTVQHRIVGGGELEKFVERVKKGLNEKTSLHYLTTQYDKGKMNKKQLLVYKMALDDAYDRENSKKVHQELMAQLTEKDKLKKEFWPVFEDRSCVVGSDDFALLLAHLPVFEKNIGKEKLDTYLYNAYTRALMPYIQGEKTEGTIALDQLKPQLDGLNIEKKADLMFTYELAEAIDSKNLPALFALIEPKAAEVAGRDALPLVYALAAVGEGAAKADFSRMQALMEKMIANPANADMKGYFERYAEQFKKKAHVGVYFEDLTFEEALKKAKAENKLVFMDCYTSWCGPCKYMASTIFPMEKMGDYLNPLFVCVKYDMEKGEGPELLEKFGVQAFPTFIMLNADGTVRHTLVGGGDADEFIERVKETFDDTKATGMMEAKYLEGNRDKAFMINYLKCLNSIYSSKAPGVAEELHNLLNDDERVSASYWFIFDNSELSPEGSAMARYLLANREKFNEAVGKAKVDSSLVQRCQREFMGVFYGDTTKTVQQLDQLRKKVVGLKLNKEKMLLVHLDVAKAILNRNTAQILTICEKATAQLPAEEVPYMNAAYQMQNLTPAQQDRWIRLGKKLMAKMKNDDYTSYIGQYLKSLEEKQGES